MATYVTINRTLQNGDRLPPPEKTVTLVGQNGRIIVDKNGIVHASEPVNISATYSKGSISGG